LAAEKGVAINLDIDSNMFLYGDPLLLQQLFHNLLSNAVKYSFGRVPSGSNRFIELGARVHDPGFRTERVQIKIQNYGIGILPHELAHLGKRGFRGSLARAERPIGFGIGVHIAREIARLHDGHIFYDSRPASKEGTSTDASLSQPHIVECLVILPGWRQGEQAAP
jgi:signal transduction histidine kinase